MKYLKKDISIVELQELLNRYKKNNMPYKLKKKIKSKIEEIRKSNKIFANNLVNSKWFKLGIIQTIRNKQATRTMISRKAIYLVDANDVMLNLMELTLKASKKRDLYFALHKNLTEPLTSKLLLILKYIVII